MALKEKRSNYVNKLSETFSPHANTKNAIPMKRYMKDKFEFFGIQSKLRRELQREFMKKDNLPALDQVEEIVKELWELPQREFQYFAMELLEKYVKKVDKEIVSLFEYMIVTKSWWDTVDMIAARLVGPLFSRFNELIVPYTEKWMYYGDMWLQRSAILFQLKYKKETDTELLFNYIQALSDSREFFIQKAIG
ncbi:DNA alkylation repair protein, partial [Fibrobacterota bacterium]